MKIQFFTLIVISAFAVLTVSCQKGPGIVPQGSWKIVSDSLYTGVGLNNHAQVCQGQSGDYFDFASDGDLYIREGSKMDTLAYKYLSTDRLLMSNFAHFTINGDSADTCAVTQTSTSMRIASPLFLTPGGEFGRIVHLSR